MVPDRQEPTPIIKSTPPQPLVGAAEGSVAIGGNGNGAINIPGSHNVVLNAPGAAAAGEVLDRQYPRALHQLRAPTSDFTGRTDLLEDLLAKIGGGATISGVQGMGGVGKTELAYVIAHRLANQYPDAQVLVELRGTDPEPLSPADALARVIGAFNPEAKLPEDVPTLRDLYLSALHGKRAIILADNAASADQVRPLLPPASCLLLVTSRYAFVVPGLQAVHLECLQESEAIALILKIAPRIGDHAGAIAKECGYLPLALRAAASLLAIRLDVLVTDYLRELTDEQKRLDAIGAEGVEVGVEASLNLSYRRLTPDAQRVLRAMAVFPGTFDAAAEETICQDHGHRYLGKLLRYSLVEFDEEDRRYRLHDLMRLFAAHRLDEPQHAAERLPAEERHADYYARTLGCADVSYLKGNAGVLTGLGLLDQEWHNIAGGQAWATAHATGYEAAAKLANTYPDVGTYVLSLRLRPKHHIQWLKAAIVAAQSLRNRKAEGYHLGNLGIAYAQLGDLRTAIAFHRQALTIAREIGDRLGEGSALGNLGLAYTDSGEPARAIESHRQALTISQEISDSRGVGAGFVGLGLAYKALGDWPSAIGFYQQALGIYRKIGDRASEASALGNLGNAYAVLGDSQNAIKFYNDQLVIVQAIGDRPDTGNGLFNLALTYEKFGQREYAISAAEKALAILHQIEDPNAANVEQTLAEWRAGGETPHS